MRVIWWMGEANRLACGSFGRDCRGVGRAGSIGLGVFQLQSGLHVLVGRTLNQRYSPSASWLSCSLLHGPLMTDLDKGVKWLSNGNMVVAILVLLFVLFAGPTAFLFRTFITAFGDYLTGVVALSFQLYPFTDVGQWLQNWTLTYWFWWIAWAPFVEYLLPGSVVAGPSESLSPE